MPAARKAPARRKTAARKSVTKRESSKDYDVVLRGTFEVRMDRIRAASVERAIKYVEGQLVDYSKQACQGNNKIEVDMGTSEAKPHVTKFEVEITLAAKTEDEARERLKSLGDDVFIDVVEQESRYGTRSRRY